MCVEGVCLGVVGCCSCRVCVCVLVSGVLISVGVCVCELLILLPLPLQSLTLDATIGRSLLRARLILVEWGARPSS